MRKSVIKDTQVVNVIVCSDEEALQWVGQPGERLGPANLEIGDTVDDKDSLLDRPIIKEYIPLRPLEPLEQLIILMAQSYVEANPDKSQLLQEHLDNPTLAARIELTPSLTQEVLEFDVKQT